MKQQELFELLKLRMVLQHDKICTAGAHQHVNSGGICSSRFVVVVVMVGKANGFTREDEEQ